MTIYPITVICVVAIVTWSLRAFPFLLFRNRPLPKTMKYLGRTLPPSIMTVLVVYCLRNTSFEHFPYGIPELFSCSLVVVLQSALKNMYLSIIVGTLCYMFMIRVL